VAANDKVKTDLRDSKKIAEQLSTNNLHGIYVPTEREEAQRTLTRTREQVVEARATASRQIKSKLYYFGLMARDDTRQITNKYLKQIESMKLSEDVAFGFKILIEQWRFLTLQIYELRRALQKQAVKDIKLEKIYQSVPGIGLITSRTLANELGDLSRFENERGSIQLHGFDSRRAFVWPECAQRAYFKTGFCAYSVAARRGSLARDIQRRGAKDCI